MTTRALMKGYLNSSLAVFEQSYRKVQLEIIYLKVVSMVFPVSESFGVELC